MRPSTLVVFAADEASVDVVVGQSHGAELLKVKVQNIPERIQHLHQTSLRQR